MNKAHLQPALRALSHEELSRSAAEMAIALAAIARCDTKLQTPAEVAEAALCNTCIEAILDLVL